jgi:hypothetical protein
MKKNLKILMNSYLVQLINLIKRKRNEEEPKNSKEQRNILEFIGNKEIIIENEKEQKSEIINTKLKTEENIEIIKKKTILNDKEEFLNELKENPTEYQIFEKEE